jgi:hypothetical protein
MANDGSMLVWLGINLAVLGQIIGAASLLLMKRAAVHEASLPFYRRGLFHIAFALFVINTVVLDAAIYMMVPLTVVAPTSALGLVFVNIGIALGLGVEPEPYGLRGIMANLLIIVGIVATGVFGPHENSAPTIKEIYASAASPTFLAYVLPGLAVSLACCVSLHLNWLPGVSHSKTVWVASAAAFFGSLSVLCFKGVATVARLMLEGTNQLDEVGSWVLLLGACICGPANVTLMNLTFEISDASLGMPLYQALVILATIVSGGLFYDEFQTWAIEVQAAGEHLRITGFLLGLTAIVVGITLVATSRPSNAPSKYQPDLETSNRSLPPSDASTLLPKDKASYGT